MSRISLVEAYDNRDVIGQLVKLRQDVKELYDIVENINPSGDLTNFVTKTGDETIDGIKTIDKIASVETDRRDRPVSDVKIITVKLHE